MNKKLYRTGPYADFFSQGVQAGNVLTLAGQLGDNEDGSVPTDIKDQMINCYNNIKNVLSEFGATLDNVIDELGSLLTLMNVWKMFRTSLMKEKIFTVASQK